MNAFRRFLAMVLCAVMVLSGFLAWAETPAEGTCGHANVTTMEEAGEAVTCLTEGNHYVVSVCADCGAELAREMVNDPPLGHDYQEASGEEDNAETEGHGPLICTRCGEVSPETPEEPAAPEAAAAGGETEQPAAPEEPAAQEQPVAPEQPENPEEPVNPGQPETPEEPAAPEQPENPEEPASPEQPAAPEEPATPEQPAAPEEPATPEQPAAPEEPAAPEQPETPEEPASPEQPAAPEEPAAPEQPATPEEPVSPEQPAAPEEPATPKQPEETPDSGESDTQEAPPAASGENKPAEEKAQSADGETGQTEEETPVTGRLAADQPLLTAGNNSNENNASQTQQYTLNLVSSGSGIMTVAEPDGFRDGDAIAAGMAVKIRVKANPGNHILDAGIESGDEPAYTDDEGYSVYAFNMPEDNVTFYAAFETDWPLVYIGGQEVTSSNWTDIPGDGNRIEWIRDEYDAITGMCLRLKDQDITETHEGYAVYAEDIDVLIETTGEATCKVNGVYLQGKSRTITLRGRLTIEGAGEYGVFAGGEGCGIDLTSAVTVQAVGSVSAFRTAGGGITLGSRVSIIEPTGGGIADTAGGKYIHNGDPSQPASKVTVGNQSKNNISINGSENCSDFGAYFNDTKVTQAYEGQSIRIRVTPASDYYLDRIQISWTGGEGSHEELLSFRQEDGSAYSVSDPFTMLGATVTVTLNVIEDSQCTYVDTDGAIRTTHNCKPVTNEDKEWGKDNQETWYYVPRDPGGRCVNRAYRVKVCGNVNLILSDDMTLEIWRGIYVPEKSSLSIWRQQNGSGTLRVDRSGDAGANTAAIGGNAEEKSGAIKVYGGRIFARGYSGGAGIGGGAYGTAGQVTILGGTVTATGGTGGAGIGGGTDGKAVNIQISGGSVTATGGTGAAGIGSGSASGGGSITITDGARVEAYAGSRESSGGTNYAIGRSNRGSGDTLTLGHMVVYAGEDPSGAQKAAYANRVKACRGQDYARLEPAEQHVLKMADNGQVSVQVDGGAASTLDGNGIRVWAGASLTITVTPDSTRTFNSITVKDAEGKETKLTRTDDNTFACVMADADLTVALVYAEEGWPVWIGMTQITPNNRTNVLNDGGTVRVRFDPEFTNGQLTAGTLTLESFDGVESCGENNAVIYAEGFDLTIVGKGSDNTIQVKSSGVNTADYGIRTSGNITLTLRGNLTAKGKKSGILGEDGTNLFFAEDIGVVTAEQTESSDSSYPIQATLIDIGQPGNCISVPKNGWIDTERAPGSCVIGGSDMRTVTISKANWQVNINNPDTEKGSIPLDPTISYNEGETVTLTVNGNDNYVLHSLKVIREDGEPDSPEPMQVNGNTWEFTMPNSNVMVEPEWTVGYNLWVGGKQVTEANQADVLGDGKVSFDPSGSVLTLKNVDGFENVYWYNNHTPILIYAKDMDLTIRGEGDHNDIICLSNQAIMGIYVDDKNLTLEGTMKIVGNRYAVFLNHPYTLIFPVSAKHIELICRENEPVVRAEIIRINETDATKIVRPTGTKIVKDHDDNLTRIYDNKGYYAHEVVIETHSHTLTKVPEVPATCEEDGHIEYWQCEGCGLLFSDEEGTNVLSRADTILWATGHDWDEPKCEWLLNNRMASLSVICKNNPAHKKSETVTAGTAITVPPTCTAEGTKLYTAIFLRPAFKIMTATETLPATGHTPEENPVEENLVPATCEKDGSYDSVVYCAVCGDELSRTKVTLTAPGHTPEENPKQENPIPATCEEDGSYDSVLYCAVCGDELSRDKVTLPATGHDWGEWTVTREASETKEGEETRTCRHDPTHKETRAIAKKPHTHVLAHIAARDSTCTLTGNIECWVCSRGENPCRKYFTDAEGKQEITLDALRTRAKGHQWNGGEVTTEPTCTENGVRTYTCTVCGATREEAIRATGHKWKDPTVQWAKDYSSATMTRICQNNPNHKETETVETTVEVVTEPTCTERGETVYTAAFTNPAFKPRALILKTAYKGHAWGEWKVTTKASGTGKGTETRTCLRDETHQETREFSYALTGSGATWIKDSGKDLTITLKRSVGDDQTLYHFNRLLSDGAEVAPDNYQRQKGSLILTVKAAWLNTLSTGKHTLTVEMDDGTMAAEITIQEKTATPTAAPTTKATSSSGSSGSSSSGGSYSSGSSSSTGAVTYDPEELVIGVVGGMSGNLTTEMFGGTAADADVRALITGYPLTRWNAETGVYEPDPSAVEEMTVTEEDGRRTYTFTLCDGLAYSDGTPITAADYAFTILLHSSPACQMLGGNAEKYSFIEGAAAYREVMDNRIAGVRIPDEHTLCLTVNAGAIPEELEAGALVITPMPVHLIAEGCTVTDDGDGARIDGVFTAELLRKTLLDETDGYRSHPAAVSGPYMVTAYDAGTGTVTLEINGEYQGDAEGRTATLPKLTLTKAEDSTVIAQLEAGELGLAVGSENAETFAKGETLAQGGKYAAKTLTAAADPYRLFVAEGGEETGSGNEAVETYVFYTLWLQDFEPGDRIPWTEAILGAFIEKP